MTKEKLYGIYAGLCRELGQSPITFKQFLTISIAAKRAEAETDFMRFVAVYGTDAGQKLINAVVRPVVVPMYLYRGREAA